jgi:hypothetical protein
MLAGALGWLEVAEDEWFDPLLPFFDESFDREKYFMIPLLPLLPQFPTPPPLPPLPIDEWDPGVL